MKVAELIEKLQNFPGDLEVRISDGYDFHFYQGDYSIEVIDDPEDGTFIDIGVGGLKIE